MLVFSAIALAFMLAIAAVASAQDQLPDGVPDVLNPQSQDEWQAFQVGNVGGEPDFPLVMFVNDAGRQPAAVMMAVDAKNGTDRWSLTSDPVVLIALFADPNTVTRVYYDAQFAQTGQPSGQYAEVANPDSEALATLLKSVVHAQQQRTGKEPPTAQEPLRQPDQLQPDWNEQQGRQQALQAQ